MRNVPENELLSAYLDGELTAAEQAEMEHLLAGSPEARQLLDEFRALSATLQSLPAQTLGVDLSQGVLRVAEGRMLAEPARPDEPLATAGAETFSWRWLARRLVRPRNLVWPAVAAAAAVLMLLNPGAQEQDPGSGRRPVALEGARTPQEPAPAPAEASGERAKRGPPTVRAADAKAPPKGVAPAPEKPAVRPPAETPKMESSPGKMKSAVGSSAPSEDKAGESTAKPAGHVVFVVRCEVTPEALARGALEKVLLSHRMTGSREIMPSEGSPAGPTRSRCVEVEGTLAQIEAAVKDLESQPGTFLAVSRPVAASDDRAGPGKPGPARAVIAAPGKGGFEAKTPPDAVGPGSGLAASALAPGSPAGRMPGPNGESVQGFAGSGAKASVRIPPPGKPRASATDGPLAGTAAPGDVAGKQALAAARQRVLFVLEVRAGHTDVTVKAAARVAPEAAKAEAKAAAAPPKSAPVPPGK